MLASAKPGSRPEPRHPPKGRPPARRTPSHTAALIILRTGNRLNPTGSGLGLQPQVVRLGRHIRAGSAPQRCPAHVHRVGAALGPPAWRRAGSPGVRRGSPPAGAVDHLTEQIHVPVCGRTPGDRATDTVRLRVRTCSLVGQHPHERRTTRVGVSRSTLGTESDVAMSRSRARAARAPTSRPLAATFSRSPHMSWRPCLTITITSRSAEVGVNGASRSSGRACRGARRTSSWRFRPLPIVT